MKHLHNELPQARLLKNEGSLIDYRQGEQGHHGPPIDIAEKGDLVPDLVGDGLIAAAYNNIWLDADAPELVNAVLGGLGLQLSRRGEVGKEGDMNIKDILPSHVAPHLADGLKEGEPLDVAHRAPHLDNNHARLALTGHLAETALYLIGNMRHHLNGAAQKIPPPLLGDDRAVNLPCGHAGGSGKVGIDEAFVVTQVKVGFLPILGDEDLTMLIGRHRPRIDINVWIQLLNGDRDVAALQDPPYRGDSDALPHRANYAAGHKDILRHPFGSLWGKGSGFLAYRKKVFLLVVSKLSRGNNLQRNRALSRVLYYKTSHR